MSETEPFRAPFPGLLPTINSLSSPKVERELLLPESVDSKVKQFIKGGQNYDGT